MFIGDLVAATGLGHDTLRWYEKIGLIPPPPRDRGGRRVYPGETLAWIAFLGRLKSTGMGIAEMRVYAALRAQGDVTAAARRELLERHRERVRAAIAALGENLAVLDDKIEIYRTIEAAAPCPTPEIQP
ncbi:MerR family transcriptional regulator [Siculibacillus lacustris]|uniref:MerR family transcriptional regulator n=1 Tax=Siculibacillus lacustris TaxID=1549641 RepID=A0A4Q9VZG6_9HYPH|nr:MerR family transcriptional regulator [Siculibacillus lacustris]TBW41208.1 MerR family transcriptional regulator [Siculibacillus lacustris]